MNFFSVHSMKHLARQLFRVDLVLALACLIALFVLLGVRGCDTAPDSPPNPTSTATDTTAGTSPVEPGDSVTLPDTADAGISYQDSLTFVGDSLTAHLVSRKVLTGGELTTQVWRTETNMLNLDSQVTSAKIIYPQTGELMTIADAAAKGKPSILIITLGTDWGVSRLNEQDFKNVYGKLIKQIKAASPETTIILQSIFPVTKDCTKLSNDKIDTANRWVKAVAAENGCRYLDTQSVLKDSENCLKKEYCISTDGIHLTAEAYNVILQYIRTHAYSK